MNILVCNVEDIMMTAIKFRLEKHGFKMVAEPDGEAAASAIKANAPEFAVIGTDLKKKSAPELIRYVREELKSELPFIVVANQEEGEEILEYLKIGANDFVLRPFKPMELVLRIKQILSSKNLAKI